MWIARCTAIVAAAIALAVPASAQATLAFVRGTVNPVVYAAADNGSSAHRLGTGSSPHVAPDGQSVVFLYEGSSHVPELRLAPAAGGASRVLLKGWREPFYLAFSPDSSQIAVLRGHELGERKLVAIDVASGAQRVVASGFFGGISFSPDGTQLVFSKAKTDNFPASTDVYRAAVAGGAARRLTQDHRSLDPLWGPTGTIVFVRQLDAKKRRYGPKNELYLMDEEGRHVKRLTHTQVDPLLQGLFPTEWSGDGSRLLAEFEGQDTSYAVSVNPRSGAQRPVDKGSKNKGETGFIGTAISRDGSTVLGTTNGFDPGLPHDVATLPYGGGGRPKVLVKNAIEPDWSR